MKLTSNGGYPSVLSAVKSALGMLAPLGVTFNFNILNAGLSNDNEDSDVISTSIPRAPLKASVSWNDPKIPQLVLSQEIVTMLLSSNWSKISNTCSTRSSTEPFTI